MDKRGPFLGNFLPFEQANENIKKLIGISSAARKYAYVPYSNFAVGAAIQCQGGEIFEGCNVENSSYGLTICAEQTAVVKAISCGKKEICAIAVVGESDPHITTPCGRCRQFLSEFGCHIEVYCANASLKEVLITNISDLLPFAFHILH